MCVCVLFVSYHLIVSVSLFMRVFTSVSKNVDNVFFLMAKYVCVLFLIYHFDCLPVCLFMCLSGFLNQFLKLQS